MKFYLSSAQDWEPYDDLKNNKLMQKNLREIKEAGVKVTFEEDTNHDGYQHIIVDIPSMKALMQIMNNIDTDLVIARARAYEGNKYPMITIYDDYIE